MRTVVLVVQYYYTDYISYM